MGNLFIKVKNLSKTDFVKVSSWSAVSTFVKMATGVISVKVVSTIIGPSGIALVGQFLNAITMISSIATGGIGQGVTKYIAEYHDAPNEQKNIITHAIRVTLAFTVLLSLLVVLFSSQLGRYIFKSDDYNSLIILFGFSLFLYSFNTILVSILNGYKSFKKFITVNIVCSLAGLALAMFLVLNYDLYGALINCIASQSIIVAVTIVFVYREPWFNSVFARASIDWTIIKKLGKFTLMTLTSAIVVPLSQLTVRSDISSQLSINDAGIWEGMNRLSTMYLMLITTSISIYYLPRLAEIKEKSLLRLEIFKTAKIVLPPLAVVCLVIYLLRDIIILVVFSSEFSPMRGLFAFQMFGDFFKIATFLLAFLYWAKGMTKVFIITEVAFSVTFVFLVHFCVKNFGLQGAVLAYAINYLIGFLTGAVLLRNILFIKNV